MKKRRTLEEVIADHLQEIQPSVAEYVSTTYSNYATNQVSTPQQASLFWLTVSKTYMMESPGIKMRTQSIIHADIVVTGIGTGGLSSIGFVHQPLWVRCEADFLNGIQNFHVTQVEPYAFKQIGVNFPLQNDLIHYIKPEEFDEVADDIINRYFPAALAEPMPFPVREVLAKVGIPVYDAPISPDHSVYGRICFSETDVLVYDENHEHLKLVHVDNMAILMDTEVPALKNPGTYNDVLGHEFTHGDKDWQHFQLNHVLEEEPQVLNDSVTPMIYPAEYSEWSPEQRMEWATPHIAARVMMNHITAPQKISEIYEMNQQLALPGWTDADVWQETIKQVADFFKVSKPLAKQRAIELGYPEAIGTWNYIDGHYIRPFSFSCELGKYESFVISMNTFDHIHASDGYFAELIESGQFAYADGMVVIKDPMYVQVQDSPFGCKEYVLTEYARAHADECCLRFRHLYPQGTGNDSDAADNDYLSREVCADLFTESTVIEEVSNQDVIEQQQQLSLIDDQLDRIMDVLPNLPTSFWGTLNAHIERSRKPDHSKMTNVELGLRTGLSERYIRLLRAVPTKVQPETVFALCIGLHLHPLYSDDLVKKAIGQYPMTKEGLFAQYLLHNHFMESLDLINEKLEAKGYEPWGNESD